MKIRLIILVLAFAAFVTVAAAQEFERGKPAELKKLTKVIISTAAQSKTGDAVKYRVQIVAVIEKAKIPNLKITEAEDEAEIIVTFVDGTETKTVRNKSREVTVEKGIVSITSKTTHRQRILVTFGAVQEGSDERRQPAVKFAQLFVKDYKAANNLK